MIRSFILITLLLLTIPAAAYECPKPPQQVAQDVMTEVKSTSASLLDATRSSYDNVAITLTHDLLAKYPNADRTLIHFTTISVACQLIMNSSLSVDEKLDRFYQLDDQMTHDSGRSAPTKLSDTTICSTTTDSVLRPIRVLFSAWISLDVDTYLAQWGADAIHKSKSSVLSGANLVAQRRLDFTKYVRVAASYSPTVLFADGRKAVVNNSYVMRFWRSNGSTFTENETENYTLECSKAGQRWVIRENNDYLPSWSKP